MGRFEKLEPGIYKVVVVGVDAKQENTTQWLLSASRLKLKNIKFNNISIIGWVGLRSNSKSYI